MAHFRVDGLLLLINKSEPKVRFQETPSAFCKIFGKIKCCFGCFEISASHLLNDNSATVSAIVALGQVIRVLADRRVNLVCLGFEPADSALPHPSFHEATCNKPFQAY